MQLHCYSMSAYNAVSLLELIIMFLVLTNGLTLLWPSIKATFFS